jgi:hypothetical protein
MAKAKELLKENAVDVADLSDQSTPELEFDPSAKGGRFWLIDDGQASNTTKLGHRFSFRIGGHTTTDAQGEKTTVWDHEWTHCYIVVVFRGWSRPSGVTQMAWFLDRCNVAKGIVIGKDKRLWKAQVVQRDKQLAAGVPDDEAISLPNVCASTLTNPVEILYDPTGIHCSYRGPTGTPVEVQQANAALKSIASTLGVSLAEAATFIREMAEQKAAEAQKGGAK